MPDKHSNTDEVREAIKEAAMYGFIEGAYDVHGIPEQSIDALFNLLTSEKRKLLLKLSKQNYLGAVPMDAIDNELASLEQLGEL